MSARTRLRSRPTVAGLVALGFVMAASPTLARPVYPHPVSVAYDPDFVLTTDLDDDGNLDLVVCEEGVAVQMGEGDGTFSPKVAYPIPPDSPPTQFLHAALGDFNADGHQDLVALPDSSAVDAPMVVFFGNGDGTFAMPAEQVPGVGTGYVAVTDLNGDGAQDLIVSGRENGVRRFLGDSDGHFGPASLILGVPGGGPVSVSDFDGDGRKDFAVTRSVGDLVFVALGNGDGSFGSPSSYDAGNGPSWVAAADFDGDGTPDLAVSNRYSNSVSVLHGTGDGTFAPQQSYDAGEEPLFVATSDLDGDGLPDLVVSNRGSAQYGSVSVLMGTGNGQFAPQTGFNWTTWDISSLGIGDFDRDGALDLASPSRGPGLVGVLFGRGDGAFVDAEEVSVGGRPSSIDVGDLDGDGRQDLAVASKIADTVRVVPATGAGTFGPGTVYPSGDSPRSIVISEFTGDTHADFAVANGGGDVSLYEGLGGGIFGSLGSLTVGVFSSTPVFVTAADLDGDDRQDLVVADGASDNLSVYLGAGDGNFGAQSFVKVGESPAFIAAGDFDGNGVPDLAVANAGAENISILLGVGDGTFVASWSLLDLPNLLGVAMGDLDGDTRQDLVAVSRNPNLIHAFLGAGDGTFFALASYNIAFYSPQAFSLADLDGDGRLDLAITGGYVQVHVLPGNGDGSFAYEHAYARRDGSEPIVTADLNLDGRPDLIAVAEAYHSVSILLNQTGPTVFTFGEDRATLVWPAVTGATSYDVYRGDLSDLVDDDDDGLPDNGYGQCITALDDDPRDTFFVDPEMPATDGEGFFYLLTVVGGDGASGPGTTSAGLERQPATPCP